MKFRVEQAREVLQSTPAVLRAMLGGMSDPWIVNNYGNKTFSPFDVVGHLIHGERTDWMPRARIILDYGEARPFEPFDRYAMYEENKGKAIGELLDRFESLRSESLHALEAMNPKTEQLGLRGTHPKLGAVTLENLLAMWTVHDLNHIAQIAKAMAFQYRDSVGPWLQWCSILRK